MLDCVPNQSLIYGFVLMPVDIPCGGDSRPVYLRMPQDQLLREPPRRFRDDLQRANYRVNCLSVGGKTLKVESLVKAWIASTLMMSDSR